MDNHYTIKLEKGEDVGWMKLTWNSNKIEVWESWDSENNEGVGEVEKGVEFTESPVYLVVEAVDNSDVPRDITLFLSGEEARGDKVNVTVIVDLDGKDALSGAKWLSEIKEDNPGVLIGDETHNPEAELKAYKTNLSGYKRTISLSEYGKVKFDGNTVTEPINLTENDGDKVYTVEAIENEFEISDSVIVTLTVKDADENVLGQDSVRLVLCKVDILEISFNYVDANTNAIDLKHHNHGNITAAEWKDGDSDGKPDEPWKNVGAWGKGSPKKKVKVKFSVAPSTATSIKVHAESNFVNLYAPDTTDPVTINLTNGVGEETFQFSADQTAIHYEKQGDWRWTWKLKEFDGTAVNLEIAQTTHDIAITAAAPVTNTELISTPVYKWVMLASCQSANGNGATTVGNPVSEEQYETNRSIVEDLIDSLPESARVDTWHTELSYDYPDDESITDSLLDDEKGSCGDWQYYFYDLCAAQGINASNGLHRRTFRIMDNTHEDPDDTTKWTLMLTDDPGINSAEIIYEVGQHEEGCRKKVIGVNTYPYATYTRPTYYWGECSSTYDNDTDDVDYVNAFHVYPFPDHAVLLFNNSERSYLYDPSFANEFDSGIRIFEGLPPPVSEEDAEPHDFPWTDRFIKDYFCLAFHYLYGEIYAHGKEFPTDPEWLRALGYLTVPMGPIKDEGLDVRLKWYYQ